MAAPLQSHFLPLEERKSNVGSKASILIVDDNVSLSTTMSLVLVHKGYSVSTSKDGPEALTKIEEDVFDIVFLDIKMPVMDGVETYKRIKKIRPDSVVIMMTAYAVEDLVQQALDEGAYGVINKPLDIEKVVNLIERVREVKKGALVLVVDDDPGTTTTLKNILIRKDFEVYTSSTGEEAIAIAREKALDIIFIDLKLPTINGLETYLTIRKIIPEVVAIIITAYRQELSDLVGEAISHSAYACLYKPLDMDVVLKLVDGVCKMKQDMR